MNKLFTKITSLCMGLAMVIGVGVAVSRQAEPSPVHAADGETTSTLIFSNGSHDGSKITWILDDVLTITQEKGSSSAAVNKSYVGNPRWYASHVITFTPAKGVTLTQMAITATSSTYATDLQNAGWSETPGTTSKNGNTVTWTGEATSAFQLVMGKQARLTTSMSVTYIKSASSATITSLTTNPDNGSEITLDANNQNFVNAEITYAVGYSDGNPGYGVTIATNPTTGVAVSDNGEGKASIKFIKNDAYEVTVKADDTHSSIIKYTVSGIDEKYYTKVTNASALKAGNNYIIGTTDGTNVMKAYVSGNNCPVLGNIVPESDDSISASYITGEVAILTLGGSTGSWTFTDQSGNKYYSGTNSNNHLKASTSDTDLDTWTIDITDEGVATITSKKASPTRTIRYNSSSNLFSTYTNGQQDISLYEIASTEPSIAVSITGELDLGVGETTTLSVEKFNGATGTVNWTTSTNSVTLSANTGDSIVVTGAKDGTAVVTASLEGVESVETTFTVTKALGSIAVTTAPTKTAYEEGETFDPTGMVVTAYFDDGSNQVVTTYDYSPKDALSTSDSEITIFYGEKTTKQNITVTARVVESIEVATNPTKTVYFAGETVELDGLSIEVTYSDGETAILTSDFVVTPSNYVFTKDDVTNGSKTFTIEYNGCDTTFDVTVVPTLEYKVNIPDGTEKATSVSIGDVLVLVSEGNSVYLNGFSTTSTIYGTYGSYTGKVGTDYTLTVEKGNTEGSFALKTKDNTYLSWTSGNSLETVKSVDDNSSWNITFQSGNIVIKNVSDSSRFIQYNKSSPRFACYTSAQAAIQAYKVVGGEKTLTAGYDLYSIIKNNFGAGKLFACDSDGKTFDSKAWASLGELFTEEIIETHYLAYAVGVETEQGGNMIQNFIAAYDYVVGKYGATHDFLGRLESGALEVNHSLMLASLGENYTVVTLVTLISLVALGGTLILRKRKELSK